MNMIRFLFLILLIGPSPVQAQSPTVTRISHVVATNAVRVVYLVESDAPPTFAVPGGRVSYTAVQDEQSGRWRTTVAATLPVCGGTLLVTTGGATVEVAQSWCQMMPVARRP